MFVLAPYQELASGADGASCDRHCALSEQRAQSLRSARYHFTDFVLEEVARETTAFGQAVKLITSGPETSLPPGVSFLDFGGHRRQEMRLA